MSSTKDAHLARISLWRGLVSSVMLLGTIYTVLSLGLIWLGYETAFSRYVLGQTTIPSLYWVPETALPFLRDGGAPRAIAAIAVAGINAIVMTFVAAVAFVAASWLLRSLQRRHSSAGAIARRQHQNPALAKAQHIDTPNVALAIYDYSGQMIVRPAPEAHFWLERVPLTAAFPLDTPHARLQLALLEILESRKDWTSDPTGHHADVPLKQHSLNVAHKMVERAPEDPLAPLIGLAHDLGKILAYGIEPGPDGKPRWVKLSRMHDHLSAHMVRVLPEFQAMPNTERRIMMAVMAYAHARDDLPIGKILSPDNPAGDLRIRSLVGHIRAADGISTAAEHAGATDAVHDDQVIEELVENLPAAVLALNINRSVEPDAKADGFAAEARSYVAVIEAALREKLAPLLSEAVQAKLAIRAVANSRRIHPSVPALALAFRQLGWLIETYRDMAPEQPVFDIVSGTVRARHVLLLSREKLLQHHRGQIEAWGDNPYPLRILPPRT